MGKRRSSTSRRSLTKKAKTNLKEENENDESQHDSQEESQKELEGEENREETKCETESECKQDKDEDPISKEIPQVTVDENQTEAERKIDINELKKTEFDNGSDAATSTIEDKEDEGKVVELESKTTDDPTLIESKEITNGGSNSKDLTKVVESDAANVESEAHEEKSVSTKAVIEEKENVGVEEIEIAKEDDEKAKEEVAKEEDEREKIEANIKLPTDTIGNLVDVDEFDATDSQLCVLDEAENKSSSMNDLSEKENLGIQSGSAMIKDLMQDLADMNRLIARAKNEIHTTKMKINNGNWKKKI